MTKLKIGDFVSTKDMSEEAYREVAKAFIAAGCPEGEYLRYEINDQFYHLPYIGWREKAGETGFFHGNGIWGDRLLTVSDVLATSPDEGGWISHFGGPMPVSKGTKVDVILRNGDFGTKLYAGTHDYGEGSQGKALAQDWTHSRNDRDIVKYRISINDVEEGVIERLKLTLKAKKEADAEYQEALEAAKEKLGYDFIPTPKNSVKEHKHD